jgi:hypothetical protein
MQNPDPRRALEEAVESHVRAYLAHEEFHGSFAGITVESQQFGERSGESRAAEEADPLLVERLKTMLTLERRENARLLQENEQHSQQNDRLMKGIEGLRSDNARMFETIAELTGLLRGRTIASLPQRGGVLREFYRLTALWKVDTIHLSDITEKCSHPAYKQIIALGPDVLPFIFEELNREPDDWFVALRTLTAVNPVPPQSRANLDETIIAWLKWAQQHGYFHWPIAEEGLPKPELGYVRREESSNTSV